MSKISKPGLEDVLWIIIVSLFFTDVASNNENVCTTTGCRTAARIMRRSMDNNVDPCENFYLYACGGWKKINQVSQDALSSSVLRKMWRRSLLKIRGEVERPSWPREPFAITIAKNYYKSCHNTDILDVNGRMMLRKVARMFGGWPMARQAVSDKYSDVTTVMAQLGKYLMNAIFSVNVKRNPEDNKERIIAISAGPLSLQPSEHEGKESNTDSYAEMIGAIAVKTGAYVSRAYKDAREIIEFESQLAKLQSNMTTYTHSIRSSYEKMTIEDLFTNVSDNLDWLDFLTKLFKHAKVPISNHTSVLLYHPEYVHQVASQWKTYDQRILRNYVVWMGMRNLVSHTGPAVERTLIRYMRKIYKKTYSPAPRWYRCMKETNKLFQHSFGRLFIKYSFTHMDRIMVLSMMYETSQAFERLINQTTWMDDVTKVAAANKLLNIKWQVGYPSWIRSNRLLNSFYQGLKTEEDTYMDNFLRYQQVKSMNTMRLLLKRKSRTRSRREAETHARRDQERDNDVTDMPDPPVLHAEDQESWTDFRSIIQEEDLSDFGAAIPNARYLYQMNAVEVTAAFLQRPLFNRHFPPFVNYGTVATTLGHEITHGFDVMGRQYNANGAVQPWWSEASVENFKNATRCFVEQYSQYRLHDRQVDGDQTLAENLADNGGVRTLYVAYEALKRSTMNPITKIEGLNMTDTQILFLRWAQLNCRNTSPKAQKAEMAHSKYSPSEYRVIGSLSNSQAFAEAYNCPTGSPMNPERKCIIW